jgi:hypothetical protein
MCKSRSSWVEGPGRVEMTVEGEVEPGIDSESSDEQPSSSDSELLEPGVEYWWRQAYGDLVEQAVTDPEIASAADTAGVGEAFLRRVALSGAEEVRSAVSSEWSRLEAAHQEFIKARGDRYSSRGFGERVREVFVRDRPARADLDAMLSTARRERELALGALRRAALERGLKQALRVRISGAQDQMYSDELMVEESPGLAELTDPKYMVSTSARSQLERRLRGMPGGSIGIAGPRGAGKTTLIRGFCGGGYVPANQRRLLPVFVSAPVEYDPRDFVLHLFSAFCRAVLPEDGGREDAALEDPTEIPGDRRRWWPLARYGAYLSVVAASVGVLLILSAFVSAVRDLRLSPPVFWGSALIVVAAALLLASRAAFIRERSREHELYGRRYETGRHAGCDLEALARRWLRRVKFQQSYSSGWSGSLRLPLGLQGGVNATRTLAQQQLSLPDLVYHFRSIVERAGLEYQVVIGIDELDKLESHEKAQNFLNEIKAVFGVEGCFYLISVSEDAMSSFERRGLPFRDAFDSALDEVVPVTYLDFDSSRLLVQRRVTGMSSLFIALCYCLAGGLARDLIRSARAIIELSDGIEGPIRLGAITERVVHHELIRKLEAIALAVRSSDSDEPRTELLSWLRDLNPPGASVQSLLAECAAFAALPMTGPNGRVGLLGPSRLRLETVCFLYFATTVMEFFRTGLDRATLDAAEGLKERPGGLDQLAIARQTFSLDPKLAWTLISDFRRHWSFRVIDFAAAEDTDPAPVQGP